MSNSKKLFGFITTIFIVLFSVTAILVYFVINISQFTIYGTKTVVGSVYIGGEFADGARQKVTTATNTWKKGAVVKLIYQGYEITLDNENFVFDVNASINQAKTGTTTPLLVDLNNDAYLSQVISDNSSTLKFTKFDLDLLKVELLNRASKLYPNIKINLGDFCKDYETNVTAINQVAISYLDADFLNTRINYLLNKITIAGETQFNLKKYVEENYADENVKLNNKELSIIATGIYQLILDTNFYNISKSISAKLPNYTTSGLEALIDDSHDLSFYNPNPFPYYITASYEERIEGNLSVSYIVFSLEGVPFIDTFSHSVQTTVMEPGEIYWYQNEYNSIPMSDEPFLAISGYEGYRSFVVRNIITYNGTRYTTIIAEDIYMPKEYVYVKRPAQNN